MPKNIYDVQLQKHTEHKYTNNLWSNKSDIIGNLDEKNYSMFKSRLMNKEDNVKHPSESKFNGS